MNSAPFPREIFRAYDIRGRAAGGDPPLTDALARQVGRAYASYLRPTNQAVVGGDQRSTTPALLRAAADGLLDGGVDVINLGRAPSPLVYWASALKSTTQPTGGLVVTASHNPPEDNGIKLLEAGGMPLQPESIQEIAERIETGPDDQPNHRGRAAETSWDVKPDYIASLAADYPLHRPLKIAIDPGNGVASITASPALTAIGAEVSAINDDPDDPNPPHPADPQHADNVAQLAQFVSQSGARLGFAFDGDGDRLGLVDGRGRRVTPDQLFALLAQDWLRRRPAAKIHIDVKTSLAVIDHIEQLGGRAIFGPVGHSRGKHAMQQQEIDFGGEASTHYFYRLDHPPHITDDAVRTACRIARMASQDALEPLLDAVPRYPISPEVKIACPDERKHRAAAEIAAYARARWPTNEIDGARIDLSADASAASSGALSNALSSALSSAWCVVRASNTTPCLTVLVEGRDDSAYAAARRITAEILDQAGLDPTPLLNQPPLD